MTNIRIRRPRNMRRKIVVATLALVALAAGGIVSAFADDDPASLVYDAVLGQTVPAANDADLRQVIVPPGTPDEGSGTVELTQGLTPDTVDPPDAVARDNADPQPYAPEIAAVDNNDPDARASNFPGDVILPTTVYSTFDGTTQTEIWAGTSTQDTNGGVFVSVVSGPNGSETNRSTLDGTGAITLTGFTGDTLFFSTASGTVGSYRISTGSTTRYTVQAFASPVDNPPTINRARAGRAIPIKWRLTDQTGAPVNDPAVFSSITSSSSDCSTSAPVDDIETYAGGSGLQYQGDGWWQFNWATPSSYAGQCRIMRLRLAGGTSVASALFQFQ
jgi:hypothetical protein